jgi:tRNA-dihydrouridine synthase B
MEIHLAPLQGHTDNAHRITHFQEIGSVDFYYSPYYSVDNYFKSSLGKPISPTPEDLFKITIPQILPGNLDELKLLIDYVQKMNVSHVNINSGCPYPMATNKGRGAALVGKLSLISDFIHYISDSTNLTIGIKTRIGLNDGTEIFNLLETLSKEKIESVTIHPRIAAQLYKGQVDYATFRKCKELFPNLDLIYNGDITSLEEFSRLKEMFPGQEKWMIGRGLLANPFLAEEIKTGEKLSETVYFKRLLSYSFRLIDEIEADSNDTGHAFNRVKTQFIYLSESFPNPKKTFKSIKKSKSMEEIRFILNHI